MMNSPCRECEHLCTLLITTDPWAGSQYMDDCNESAPDGVFMSEWGCWRFDERQDDD